MNVQAPIPDVRNASAVNGLPNDGVSQNSYDVNRAFTEFEAQERARYTEATGVKTDKPIFKPAQKLTSRQKQNLLQRVIGYIRDMIARPTGKISGNFKNVSEFTESLKDAESKLTQIYKEAAGKTGSFEGEIKYSDSQQHIYDYTKSFAEQVEDYKNDKIPEYDSLLLGETPDVFKKLGFNSLPVTINQRHVDYALNGTKDIDHHIGEAMLSQLPEAIKDPVAVMRSQTKPNRLVALLEFTYNGRNLFAPFEIDGYGRQNSIRIDSNAIVSVYAKDNAISKQLRDAIQDEANGKISLFYLNKNKADVLLQSSGHQLPGNLFQNNGHANVLLQRAGLQLPGGLFQNNGFIHSIREKGANVNTRFENVTETQHEDADRIMEPSARNSEKESVHSVNASSSTDNSVLQNNPNVNDNHSQSFDTPETIKDVYKYVYKHKYKIRNIRKLEEKFHLEDWEINYLNKLCSYEISNVFNFAQKNGYGEHESKKLIEVLKQLKNNE